MRQLHNDINLTTIFVTHDQEEAMEVADKVVVMNNGRIEQIGTPLEVYQNPSNAFVYKFLGNYNEFNGIKDEKGLIHLSEFEGDNENTTIDLPKYQPSWFKRNLSFLMKKVTSAKAQAILPKTNSNVVGEVVKVFARPHEMDIKKEPTNGYLAVKIVHINAAGSFVKLDMARENGSLISAEMAQDILENLSIAKNDIVYTRPRDTKIFGNTAKV
jgi:sulfate transport system ATP-binding protein